MLVLSRKLNQEIVIGENITITVLKIKGNTVRLGIEAPREIHVVRGELPRPDEFAPSNTDSQTDRAEFTVVFSNSNQDQMSNRNVIPFDGSTSTSREVEPADEIKFRGTLPTALHHNRLKEIVDRITTKTSTTNN